jgi:heat shock protein HtpX
MNNLKTAVLLAALSGLLIAIGGSLGGTNGAITALVQAGVMNFGSYWFSADIVLRSARAREIQRAQDPELFAIVEDVSRAAGMPMPRVYVMAEAQPNAFATGRDPEHAAVAVTEGILRTLTWDELRGVLAHEISHVGNRDILISSVAAAVAMGITFLARIVMWGAVFGGGGGDRDRDGGIFGLLAMTLLAPIAAGLLQMALSRSREYEADRSGAALLGDGEPLARALQKIEASARRVPMDIDPAHAQAFIVNPLTGRRMQFASLFRTHPPTEDRVARLRAGSWR